MSKRTKSKNIFGVGVNDAKYLTHKLIDGSQVVCKFYQTWASMITRCYSPAYLNRKPTYIGCNVCHEWLVFSVFREWMIKQDWEGKTLDKDILSDDKIYSPERCVFVSSEVNNFCTNPKKSDDSLPTGVVVMKDRDGFVSFCRNPKENKSEYLGNFQSKELAHIAWATKKLSHARYLAGNQKNKKVSDGLINKYLKIYNEANK